MWSGEGWVAGALGEVSRSLTKVKANKGESMVGDEGLKENSSSWIMGSEIANIEGRIYKKLKKIEFLGIKVYLCAQKQD